MIIVQMCRTPKDILIYWLIDDLVSHVEPHYLRMKKIGSKRKDEDKNTRTNLTPAVQQANQNLSYAPVLRFPAPLYMYLGRFSRKCVWNNMQTYMSFYHMYIPSGTSRLYTSFIFYKTVTFYLTYWSVGDMGYENIHTKMRTVSFFVQNWLQN